MAAENAIEILSDVGDINRCCEEDAEALDMAIKALEQTRWIPCAERLPKNDDDVLVCNSQGVMEVCYYHIDDTFYPTEYAGLNETGWFNENDDALYFEPVAWMPLPEPYKAESEGEEWQKKRLK